MLWDTNHINLSNLRLAPFIFFKTFVLMSSVYFIKIALLIIILYTNIFYK